MGFSKTNTNSNFKRVLEFEKVKRLFERGYSSPQLILRKRERVSLILLEPGKEWILDQETLAPIQEEVMHEYLMHYCDKPKNWREAIKMIRSLHEGIGRHIRHTREDNTIIYNNKTYRGKSNLESKNSEDHGQTIIENIKGN